MKLSEQNICNVALRLTVVTDEARNKLAEYVYDRVDKNQLGHLPIFVICWNTYKKQAARIFLQLR